MVAEKRRKREKPQSRPKGFGKFDLSPASAPVTPPPRDEVIVPPPSNFDAPAAPRSIPARAPERMDAGGWPAGSYRVAVQTRRRAAFRNRPVEVPRMAGRYVEHGTIDFDDYLNRIAPKPPKAPKAWGDDTTDSASAAGLRWLANEYAAGVAIDIGECELAAGDPLDDLARHQAFMRFVTGTEPDGAKHRGMEKRYLELCRFHDDNPHRLMQNLRREWPAWLREVRGTTPAAM